MSQWAELVRAEHGRLVAALARTTGGDLQLAEDALQEAVVAALQQWGDDPPDQPVGWLLRTARNKAIDVLRRRGTWARKARLVAAATPAADTPDLDDDGIADERLRLICTCCHPALSLSARVALTLKVVSGRTSDEVARLFLVDRATMQQRIVRAKQKIRLAGIPYEVPSPDALPERLAGIRHVIYLVFTEGWGATAGERLVRGELCDEALRLGQLLVEQVPDDGELHGLLSLMWLTDARRATRVDAQGLPVLLADQDRSRWDARSLALGAAALGAALRRGPPGPYTLQAAIASVHARAQQADDTAWDEVVALYELLLKAAPSPVVRLNHAAAVGQHRGPVAGLAALDALADERALGRTHLLPAARARYLEALGRTEEALDALQQALSRVGNAPERAWLEAQVARLLGQVSTARA